MRARPRGRVAVWPVPLLLAGLSLVGLLAALLGDGPWDALSWLALGVPAAVALSFGYLPRRRDRSTDRMLPARGPVPAPASPACYAPARTGEDERA